MDARFAGAFLAALALANGALAAATPCDQLAAYARKLPDGAWAKGDKALAPVLELDEARPIDHASPFEKSLVKLPAVRTGLDGETSSVFIDHLAGGDLYLLSSFQGTLDCQQLALVDAAVGRKPRAVKPPSGLGDICWRRSATLGKVAGQAAFIVHDTIDPADRKASFDIRPFDGRAFGPACAVTLKFRAAYAVSERHCGNAVACAAAGGIAKDVALAYNRAREGGADGSSFTYGPAGAGQAAMVKAFLAGQDSPPTWTPDFPAFGKEPSDDHPISYGGFALFPLTLQGRDLVGAIGHEGVGWREGENTLFAVYALKDGALDPLAGFVITRSLAGLESAKVEPAGAGAPRH